MNSTNPRLDRLKELIALEERRVAVQQDLETLTLRMNSLRDSLFEEGPASAPSAPAAKVAAPAPAPAVKAAAPARGRAAATERSPRGALKEKIVSALDAAGSAGIRVTELAAALKIKPVNIHSWFHSAIERYPQIKKIQGGHYRLEGSISAAPAKAGAKPASASAPAKEAPKARSVGRPPKAKTASPATKSAKGSTAPHSKRGELSSSILEQLSKSGTKGISVNDIAQKVGAKYRNISIWFATTGKKNSSIEKVAPATYRLKK